MTRAGVVCLGVLVSLAAVAPARAAGVDPLLEAEAAGARVDFEAVRIQAGAALRRGGYGPAQLLRIYYLLGVAHAALGQDAPATEAFKRLLELDPRSRIDQDLSPRLRSPMHEARGFWAARRDHLALEVVLARAENALRLRITDTLPMGKRVLVRARAGDVGPFAEIGVPVAPLLTIPLPIVAGDGRIEFMVALLDESGNRLVEQGSELLPLWDEPAAASTARSRSTPPLPGAAAVAGAAEPPAPASRNRSGLRVAGITGVVLGVAAAGGGVASLLVGSAAAERWNDDARCLTGGQSRETNCADDRRTAETARWLSIAGFAAGGALLVAATTLLVVSSGAEHGGAPSRAPLSCGPGPGLGLACAGRF